MKVSTGWLGFLRMGKVVYKLGPAIRDTSFSTIYWYSWTEIHYFSMRQDLCNWSSLTLIQWHLAHQPYIHQHDQKMAIAAGETSFLASTNSSWQCHSTWKIANHDKYDKGKENIEFLWMQDCVVSMVRRSQPPISWPFHLLGGNTNMCHFLRIS